MDDLNEFILNQFGDSDSDIDAFDYDVFSAEKIKKK
jgi:hypothetical protein